MTNTVFNSISASSPVATHHAPVTTSLFVLLVAAVTAVPFLPALWNGFVNWDDPTLIVNNPHIRSLDRAHIRWMFTNLYLGPYQPLSWLSLAIDYRVWGLKPFGFHLTSLIMHVVNVSSLFILSRRLLWQAQPDASNSPIALNACATLSAIVFAVHPLRVESVVWVTERRDVLSGVFAIWTVTAYLRAVQTKPLQDIRIGWLAASVLLFVGSLLSKASAMSLPLVLSVLDVYPLKRLGTNPREWWRRESGIIWLEKLPYWAASAAAALLALYGQRISGALNSIQVFGVIDRLVIASFGSFFYLWKTLVPFGLSPLYELPSPTELWSVKYIGGGLAGFAVTVGLVVFRKRLPAALAVWLCYLILLTPVSGLAQSGAQITADRYSYLPCVGFAVLAGGAALDWLRRQSPDDWSAGLSGFGIIAVVAGTFGTLTWRQSHVWHDGDSLWKHALDIDPTSSMVHSNLAQAMIETNRLDRALQLLNKAIAIRPENADAHNDLGIVYKRLGQKKAAMEHYQLAVQLRPRSAPICHNLGLLLTDQELLTELGYHNLQAQWQDATEWYRRSLDVQPDYVTALNDLGIVLKQLGQVDQAVAVYEQAVKIDPGSFKTHFNLALALAAQGDDLAATMRLRWVLENEPGNAGATYNLALLLERGRAYAEAIDVLRSGLRHSPDHASLLLQLSWLLATAPDPSYRNGQEAATRAEDLSRKTGGHDPRVLDVLAAAYAETGHFENAIEIARLGLEIAEERRMPELARQLEERLGLYQSGRPFRSAK